jgi:hypothetical protein
MTAPRSTTSPGVETVIELCFHFGACRRSRTASQMALLGRCSTSTSFRFWSFVLSYEPVAGSMHGEKVLRLFRIGLELLAQMHQVGIDCTGGWRIFVSPDLLQ